MCKFEKSHCGNFYSKYLIFAATQGIIAVGISSRTVRFPTQEGTLEPTLALMYVFLPLRLWLEGSKKGYLPSHVRSVCLTLSAETPDVTPDISRLFFVTRIFLKLLRELVRRNKITLRGRVSIIWEKQELWDQWFMGPGCATSIV